jgi:hypothetical protein
MDSQWRFLDLDRRTVEQILNWLSGALILSGLWMIDELLTLAQYCGKNCLYPIPLLGSFHLYDAEGIAWGLVFIGAAILLRKYK